MSRHLQLFGEGERGVGVEGLGGGAGGRGGGGRTICVSSKKQAPKFNYTTNVFAEDFKQTLCHFEYVSNPCWVS